MTTPAEDPKKRPDAAENPSAKKMAEQCGHLTRFLVSQGFTLTSSKSPEYPREFIFLMKDSPEGKEKMGIRIFTPQGAPYLQLTMFGSDEENGSIVDLINASGNFTAIKEEQDKGVIGEYYNVTMIKEPPGMFGRITFLSEGTTNRIWALLKKVITG